MADRLRILHVFRAPVGGLFRHVLDLAQAQATLGHEIGIICDAAIANDAAEDRLEAIAPHCALGVQRTGMRRLPGVGDALCTRRIIEHCRQMRPHIVHGHGAKGGAYARAVAAKANARAVYTPHGGSMHYSWRSPAGALFLMAEKMLLSRTDGLVFVCEFERRIFDGKVGLNGTPYRVVHNGLWPHEFETVEPHADSADLLFVGELRDLKGVDVLIEAIARLKDQRRVSAVLVGDGADRGAFEALVARRHLMEQVCFTGPLPARQAFRMGRLLVLPSRAESFPYVVLEAMAAGVPLIASRVGGIPELLEEEAMVRPGDPEALAAAIVRATASMDDQYDRARQRRARMNHHLRASRMAACITGFYEELLENEPVCQSVA